MDRSAIVAPAKIAVLGLGKMGAPMARRLADAGYVVNGWTRSQRLPESAGQQVQLCESVAKAVKNAAVVIGMLASPEALEDAITKSLADLAPDVIVIDMGTSGVESAHCNAAAVRVRGGDYLDAPVSGGVEGAEKGSLTIFVGGETPAFDRARPVFEAMGTPHHLGATGVGQAAKLANQIIVAITIAAVAEGITFAEALRLDVPQFLKALQGGFADSAVLRTHGPRMAARHFPAGGAITFHLKDINLAFDAANGTAAKLRHADLVRQVFADLVEAGDGNKDHSGYLLSYERDSPASV